LFCFKKLKTTILNYGVDKPLNYREIFNYRPDQNREKSG